jgi:indolepyruvate ferredoxin oxidoreductase alpha subunit
VLEELDDFLEEQIRALGLKTEGKSIIPRVGELSPERIRASWQARAPVPVENGDLTTAPRPPRICPGCQYLGVYTVIERLNVTVTGDIGCYTLGALPPFNSLDTVVCMGSSIGMAIGMEKSLGTRATGNLLAIIGDGTLLHAGIPALLDMVYNESHFTVLVMDNGTTAMTGLQGHPGNGVGLQQRQAPTVDIEKLLAAIGIRWVRVVNAYDLAATERTLREALAHAGPSVVISRNPCLLLECKPPVQQAWVDREACTGCGDCAQVGCIAVEFAAVDDPMVVPTSAGNTKEYPAQVGTPVARAHESKRAHINLELCVGCSLCVQVCPEGAIAPRPVSSPVLQISWPGPT